MSTVVVAVVAEDAGATARDTSTARRTEVGKTQGFAHRTNAHPSCNAGNGCSENKRAYNTEME